MSKRKGRMRRAWGKRYIIRGPNARDDTKHLEFWRNRSMPDHSRLVFEAKRDRLLWNRFGKTIFNGDIDWTNVKTRTDWFIIRDKILESLKNAELEYERCIVLEPGKYTNLWLHWRNDYSFWKFVEIDHMTKLMRVSVSYSSREKAYKRYYAKQIVWAGVTPLPIPD